MLLPLASLASCLPHKRQTPGTAAGSYTGRLDRGSRVGKCRCKAELGRQGPPLLGSVMLTRFDTGIEIQQRQVFSRTERQAHPLLDGELLAAHVSGCLESHWSWQMLIPRDDCRSSRRPIKAHDEYRAYDCPGTAHVITLKMGTGRALPVVSRRYKTGRTMQSGV